MNEALLDNDRTARPASSRLLLALRLDSPLLVGILAICAVGMMVLYSASGESVDTLMRQAVRLGVGFGLMLVIAQIPPQNFRLWTPWIYLLGIGLLLWVAAAGVVGQGAQRWIDLGFIRFQPSEGMKIAVPMMVAWFIADRGLPVSLPRALVALLLALLPAAMVAVQPDLGTSLLVLAAGIFALFLAGLRWRWIMAAAGIAAAAAPVVWMFMRDYQRNRVLTFLSPENDPLGTGYHIIQSKIAVGSGGPYGKGWLNGTQAHLDFLPERSTDFVFAVFGEEFGLFGGVLLILAYLFVVGRCLYIAAQAQDSYGRLLAGSLGLMLFVYVFVNLGMVVGLLPVVGIPLPLVSYGGTSMVTLLAAFGIIMSIRSHKRVFAP